MEVDGSEFRGTFAFDMAGFPRLRRVPKLIHPMLIPHG